MGWLLRRGPGRPAERRWAMSDLRPRWPSPGWFGWILWGVLLSLDRRRSTQPGKLRERLVGSVGFVVDQLAVGVELALVLELALVVEWGLAEQEQGVLVGDRRAGVVGPGPSGAAG